MQANCIIPALPILSSFRNSKKLFSILCGTSGSKYSKMAVLKEEILISQHIYNIADKLQRQNPCFQGWGIHWRYFQYCVTQAEVINSRWRLTKPEILISQHVYSIAEKFQRRHRWFRGWEIPWRHFQYWLTQAEVENLRWRLTNRKYLHLSLYTIYLRNSNGCTHVFKVRKFNETFIHHMLCKREAEIKMANPQQEILMFVSRHLGFLTYPLSHTVRNSFCEFFVFENMGIAVGILQLHCIKAEI